MPTKKKAIEPVKAKVNAESVDNADVELFNVAQLDPRIVTAAGVINGDTPETIFKKIVATAKQSSA
jgi:hypothetical protein